MWVFRVDMEMCGENVDVDADRTFRSEVGVED